MNSKYFGNPNLDIKIQGSRSTVLRLDLDRVLSTSTRVRDGTSRHPSTVLTYTVYVSNYVRQCAAHAIDDECYGHHDAAMARKPWAVISSVA